MAAFFRRNKINLSFFLKILYMGKGTRACSSPFPEGRGEKAREYYHAGLEYAFAGDIFS
jgi:hypothetical protein